MTNFTNNSTNAETLEGSSGDDLFENILGADTLNGLAGSDVFQYLQAPAADSTIDGGTGAAPADATVDSTSGDTETKGNTLSAKVTYLQTDMLDIVNNMDLSGLAFTHIEKIQLHEGVELTMSGEQFLEAMESLEYSSGTDTFNPGLQIFGVAGGSTEKLTIEVESGSNFELDDTSTAFLFHDVDVTIHFEGGNVRYDGTAAPENIIGGDGTDYITSRLGNDVVHAGGGSDLLIGHEGADQLFGEDGDDYFVISRLATKAGGGTFTVGKASDGTAEWTDGDLVNGGDGTDELRITASGANVNANENTVVLTEANFQNVEKVVIGTSKPKDAKFAAVQDQVAGGDYTPITTGKDAINVDASALKSGVSFSGNDGNNIIKAGAGNDFIYANDGNDILSGGLGNDYLNGGAGEDTLILDPSSLSGLHVLLTKDHNLLLTNSISGEKDSFISIEKADINGQVIDVNFLNQATAQLQNIGLVDKLLFNVPHGDHLISFANQAGDARALADAVLSSTEGSSAFGNMSNAQFAATIVNNGLGIQDAAITQIAETYLQDHSRAELVAIGVNYQPVIDHAFAGDGLTIL